MNESFEYYASKLLEYNPEILIIEAGAIVAEYRMGTNNGVYHYAFLVIMLGRAGYFFWTKWQKSKKTNIEIENAELENEIKKAEIENAELEKNNNILNQKIKLEQLLLLEKFNKQDTAEEQLNKFKRKREWLEENIKKNEKH